MGIFFFQVFPYFLVLKDAPGPSCIFLTPFLESDTSPKLPHLAPESGPWLWSRFHILDYSSPRWSHKELFLGSSSEESGEMSESKAQKSMKGLPKTATTQEFLTFMLLYPQPPVICKNNYLRFSSQIMALVSSAPCKHFSAVTLWVYWSLQFLVWHQPPKFSWLVNPIKVIKLQFVQFYLLLEQQ